MSAEHAEQLLELQRTFVVPRPLTESRPRDVQLTAAGRMLVGVAIALCVGALAVGLVIHRESARQAANRRALLEQGITVPGEVARLWRDGDNRRRVEYRFVVDGRAYTARVHVSAARRRSLEVGSPIDVRHVPGNPALNDLGGMPGGGLPPWLSLVVAASMMGAAGVCLLVIRRQHQLLSDGRIVPGIVTAHHKHKSSHGSHQSVRFQFPLLSGAVVSGKSGMPKGKPTVGSVICVVYDPDKPTRHGIYPLALVKPM